MANFNDHEQRLHFRRVDRDKEYRHGNQRARPKLPQCPGRHECGRTHSGDGRQVERWPRRTRECDRSGIGNGNGLRRCHGYLDNQAALRHPDDGRRLRSEPSGEFRHTRVARYWADRYDKLVIAMPLLSGKRNIGRNIETEKNAGKTHEQALAIALNVARKHRADGGATETVTRLHTGPIHSSVAGRTDHLPIHVPSGSYVLPADCVSHLGENNTAAGFKVLRRMFGGEPYGQSTHPYGQSKGPYGSGSHPYDKEGGPYDSPVARATGGQVRHRAAGILFVSPEKEVLLMRRRGKDHAGEWALPAGGIEKGETPEQAARRETEEEAGYSHEGGLSPFMHSQREGVDFTTFIAHSARFKPTLNDEHDDAKWVKPSEAEKSLPLHPGVRKALEKLSKRAGKARGGESSGVPIVAAGGEWVIPPRHVEQVGGGDIDMGHKVLDEFVKRVRKELIGTLQKLPGPRRD